jgi:hypothetical protein
MQIKLVGSARIFGGVPNSTTANCCFPSIARLPSGTLLASWRTGTNKDSDDGAIWLARSTDGTTWSQPQLVLQAGQLDGLWGEPHYGPLTVLHDGSLLCTVMWVVRPRPGMEFFNPQTEGLLPLRTLFYVSHDEGLTWRLASEMDGRPYAGPLAITGPVLQLADGTLACPFEVNKPYDDTTAWRHAAAIKFSRDSGKTWPACVEIANDPTGHVMYWDAHVVPCSTNYWVAAFWTFDRQHGVDRSIHIAHSTDAGQTWSPPRDLQIVGQVAEPVPLGDDRLVLIYVDRFGSASIRARLSHDLGKTFEAEELVIYEHAKRSPNVIAPTKTADYLQDMSLWTFGRVQAVAHGDTIWLVYYAGNAHNTAIYCARLLVE